MSTNIRSADTGPAGVIHDLGYRSYEGVRYGRSRIVAALAWHSFRSAFGFGRGAKAKILPAIAIVVLLLPAVINAYAMSQGEARLVPYDTYRASLMRKLKVNDLVGLVKFAIERNLTSTSLVR